MTAPRPERWLYLSPHLDDVALSCGGQIALAARRAATIDIVTLFAGDEPGPGAPPASPLVTRIFDLWGLAPGEVMATRRREDLAASAVLGANALHWELQEAIHRRHPASGEALYPSLDRLFGPLAPAEEPLVEALAQRLSRLAAEVGATHWVAPLGVGGHVDHRLVRAAAERCVGRRATPENLEPPGLYFYEEFPYIVWKRWALWRAGIRGRRWESRSLPLSDAEIAVRVAAIACYASQVTPLFRGPERIQLLVRRHVRRAGGERLWRRLDSSPSEWPF